MLFAGRGVIYLISGREPEGAHRAHFLASLSPLPATYVCMNVCTERQAPILNPLVERARLDRGGEKQMYIYKI